MEGAGCHLLDHHMEEQLHLFLYCQNSLFEEWAPSPTWCSGPRSSRLMEGPAPWSFGAETAGIQQAGSAGGQENDLGESWWDSWHLLCSSLVVPWAGGTFGLAWEVELKLTPACSSARSGEHKLLGGKKSFKCLNKSWVGFSFGRSVHLSTHRYGEAPNGFFVVDKEPKGLGCLRDSLLSPSFVWPPGFHPHRLPYKTTPRALKAIINGFLIRISR